MAFDAQKLTDFGLCCYIGDFDQAQRVRPIEYFFVHHVETIVLYQIIRK